MYFTYQRDAINLGPIGAIFIHLLSTSRTSHPRKKTNLGVLCIEFLYEIFSKQTQFSRWVLDTHFRDILEAELPITSYNKSIGFLMCICVFPTKFWDSLDWMLIFFENIWTPNLPPSSESSHKMFCKDHDFYGQTPRTFGYFQPSRSSLAIHPESLPAPKNPPFESNDCYNPPKTNDVSFLQNMTFLLKGGDLSIFQATVRLFCDMNIYSHGENVRCCQRLLPRYTKRHGHEGNNLPEAKRWSWKPTMNMVDRGYGFQTMRCYF